jgi:catechol 2,3-dioxygenase-like lactoylglutathione lyase family enzyme
METHYIPLIRRVLKVTVTLNHTIVHARDPEATAKFLTSILGLPAHRKLAHFTVVDVGVTSLDFLPDRADRPHSFRVPGERDRVRRNLRTHEGGGTVLLG